MITPKTKMDPPLDSADRDRDLAERAILVPATHSMVTNILRANFTQWSPGLTRERYYHYQWWQYSLPWSRRHLSCWAFADGDTVLSSCKLYDMTLRRRGVDYRVAGIGAVFTPEHFRGQGYAIKLMKHMIDLCKAREYDAVMLNSDIDPAYYEKSGFVQLGHTDFSLRFTDNYVKHAVKDLDRRFSSGRDERCNIRDLSLTDVSTMVRHHTRWLARQPYGFVRSDDYWHFKLARERHLHKNSRYAWPKQEIIALNFERHNGGYALFELGKYSIRVLEVIGNEETVQALWAQLLQVAARRGIHKITGWEASAPQELDGVEIADRKWSRPMMAPLRPEVEICTAIRPSPLLELDHY